MSRDRRRWRPQTGLSYPEMLRRAVAMIVHGLHAQGDGADVIRAKVCRAAKEGSLLGTAKIAR